MTDTILVDSVPRWASVAPRVRDAEWIGCDIEADGFHRYPEQVALIQVALPDGTTLLIDTLAVRRLDALGDVLADPTRKAIFHAADYDVRSLDRDFGFRVAGLFDTAVAASLTGAAKTGLGNVAADVLGVALTKPKKLQRMDWSIRPLPADALAYAADDVAYLRPLHDRLAERLAELGRAAWHREECERLEALHFEPPEGPEVAFLSVTGARELSPQSRAILRETFVFRDREARRIGRPPHRVLPANVLVEVARNPETPLEELAGIPARTRREAGRGLKAAIERGLAAEPVPWPRARGRNLWTPDARARLALLKAWRTKEAERLELDVGVIWSSAFLERLALHPDAPLEELDVTDPPGIRRWQWTELGPSLEAFRAQAFSPARPESASATVVVADEIPVAPRTPTSGSS